MRWAADFSSYTLEHKVAEVCRMIAASKKKTVRMQLENSRFIHGIVRRLNAEFFVSIDRFDQGELFNTPGGTASLAVNGAGAWALRAHRRDDYLTKLSLLTPVRGACPLWLAFLDRITAGDHELADYLQRIAGYCLTPYITEQCFFFFYGRGGNGKGTLLRVWKRLLGDYATAASLDLLLEKKFEGHPEELAGLRGVRLVIATETGQGKQWDDSKLKAMTGGDPIRARFMRQNSFEYTPQFKIIVSGNNKPTFRSVDAAIKRRLQVVPFTVDIPLSEQDGMLEHRLIEKEGPAILAWMLAGYEQWREHGLSPPDTVVTASEEYLEEQDEVGQWIEECCELGEYRTGSGVLFVSWSNWASARGLRAGTIKMLVEALKKKNLQQTRTSMANGFYGIRLRPDEGWHDD